MFNTLFILPVFPVLHYSGIEPFEWPNSEAVAGLIVNAILGSVISDYCWAKSVVLLGPLLPTLGLALTFPISAVIDRFNTNK